MSKWDHESKRLFRAARRALSPTPEEGVAVSARLVAQLGDRDAQSEDIVVVQHDLGFVACEDSDSAGRGGDGRRPRGSTR